MDSCLCTAYNKLKIVKKITESWTIVKQGKIVKNLLNLQNIDIRREMHWVWSTEPYRDTNFKYYVQQDKSRYITTYVDLAYIVCNKMVLSKIIKITVWFRQ